MVNDNIPQRDGLFGWTVYDHPDDYPDSFIARQWMVCAGCSEPVYTGHFLKAASVAEIRKPLESVGLIKIERTNGDDPKILEVWI